MTEDENVKKENLCYTELPVSQPYPILRPDEQVQLAPIVQTIVVNADVKSNTSISPIGEVLVNSVDKKGKPTTVNPERKASRTKNLIVGFIMLLISIIVLLPFIFSLDAVAGKLVNVFASLPCLNFQGSMNAIQNLIVFFSNKGDMATIWKSTVPSFLLGLGLLFVVLNILKAFVGILGGVKGRKYVISSLITLGAIAVVIVLQIIGVESIGLPKVDFVQEVVFGWKYSQSFVLIAVGIINALAAVICAVIVPKAPPKMWGYDYRR